MTNPELRTRIVWGVALAVTALGFAAIGSWPMTIAVAMLVALVAHEWATITIGDRLDATIAIAGAAVIATVLAGAGQAGGAATWTLVGAVGAGLWLRSLWAVTGVVYAAAIGVAIVVLRDDPASGLKAVFFVLATVWATDTAAYLVGRRLGGPKLWRAVSPNKTWSGAIGGAIGGLGVAVLAAWIMGVPVTFGLAAVALGLSIISQCGDLAESAVKRRFGVKDSGALIPGHGGIMDRVDALAFAVVAAVIIGLINGAWPLVATGLLSW